MQELFSAAVRIMETLDEYLLERGRLLLNPAYIYRNLDRGGYVFTWFPFSQNTPETAFRNLTEYILPRIDHKDKDAVTMGYGVYKESVESCMDMNVIKGYLFADKKTDCAKMQEAPEELYTEQENKEKEAHRQKILDDFYEEDEEEENGYWMIPGIILAVFCAVWMCFFRKNKYVMAVFFLVFFLSCMGGGLWFFLKKRGNQGKISQKQPIREYGEIREEKETGEERFVSQMADKGNMTVVLQENVDGGACLRSTDGNTKQTYFLQKENIWIGKRKESVDIWLDVPTVSRIHAKIVHRAEGDYVVDLNSRNGTFINGNSLNPEEEYLLETGNVIRFAEAGFFYFSSG